MTTHRKDEETDQNMPDEGQEALSMLRNVWSAQGQTSLDIEQSQDKSSCSSDPKHPNGCKDLTFEAMADEFEPTTDTQDAITTLQSAWHKKLEEEGKLEHEGTSVRDIVLGSSESSH